MIVIIGPPAELPEFDDKWKAACLSCKHLQHERPAMRCAVAPLPGSKALQAMHESRGLWMYCIDARDINGPCGPDAKLRDAK